MVFFSFILQKIIFLLWDKTVSLMLGFPAPLGENYILLWVSAETWSPLSNMLPSSFPLSNTLPFQLITFSIIYPLFTFHKAYNSVSFLLVHSTCLYFSIPFNLSDTGRSIKNNLEWTMYSCFYVCLLCGIAYSENRSAACLIAPCWVTSL